MSSSKKIEYAGSRIEVEGHGYSLSFPDRITLTFVSQIKDLEGEKILTQIDKVRKLYDDAINAWVTDDDSIEMSSYSIEKDAAEDSFSAKIEVQVTTPRQDDISNLIKVLEKDVRVDYTATKFDFTDEKAQKEKDEAIKEALFDANENLSLISKATGVTASRVISMKVATSINHDNNDNSFNTFSTGMGGMFIKMKLVKTTADVSVTYQVDGE